MKNICFAVLAMMMFACQPQAQTVQEEKPNGNPVIETIMSRRSIRQYQPQAVSRDTMDIILKCGINAPNAMNMQDWEVRVIDNAEKLNAITELFKAKNPEMAERDKGMKNMFRNAPTVVLIASEKGGMFSQVDCALLAENVMLAAWSMGIGSVCMAGPVQFLKSPDAADFMAQVGFSENYEVLLAIGLGYPAESPAARPRDESKVKYVD